MAPDFQHLMQEAARLTRAGDLSQATAAIQAALAGGRASAADEPAAAPSAARASAPASRRHDDRDVIDVDVRDVPVRGGDLPAPSTGQTVAAKPAPAGARSDASPTASRPPDGHPDAAPSGRAQAAGDTDAASTPTAASDAPATASRQADGHTAGSAQPGSAANDADPAAPQRAAPAGPQTAGTSGPARGEATWARLGEQLRAATAQMPRVDMSQFQQALSDKVGGFTVPDLSGLQGSTFTAPGLSGLQGAGLPGMGANRAARAGVADDPRFTSGTFALAGDQRDYKLYIPSSAGAHPLPLVVMLHGCTQDPDDFAAGTRMNAAAEAQGFYVLYPAQSTRMNPQGCWNWFKHTHQQRGRGEPALIAGMVQDLLGKHAIDADRVFVAGLSAGGAMAAILGETYPDVFAAVGVHSGLAAGAAADLPAALSAMRGAGAAPAGKASGIPTIVFHGDGDTTVSPANGQHVIAASVGARASGAAQPSDATAGLRSTRRVYRDPASDRVMAEHWLVHGAGHAWSGGSAQGSYTEARGPDATGEMLRFFLEHPRTHRA